MIPVGILASGRGSNFEAILRAEREGKLSIDAKVVISDRKDAPVLELAKRAGIPAFFVDPRGGRVSTGQPLTEAERRSHDARMVEILAQHGCQFVVMAGYMRLVTPVLLDAFQSGRGYSRVVNIHPSLLPAFPGVRGYDQAFSHGAKVSGVTVHLVSPEMDGGPICAQEAFDIRECASVAEVERKGLVIEHRLYPETLRWVLPERFELKERNGRFSVCAN